MPSKYVNVFFFHGSPKILFNVLCNRQSIITHIDIVNKICFCVNQYYLFAYDDVLFSPSFKMFLMANILDAPFL